MVLGQILSFDFHKGSILLLTTGSRLQVYIPVVNRRVQTFMDCVFIFSYL